MKAVLFLALLFVVAVLVSSNYCGLRNGARVDPTPCVHNCPGGYQKACEHGGICTCAKTCVERLDCFNVTCNEVHHPITGLTMYREDAHCLDSACMCAPLLVSSNYCGLRSGARVDPTPCVHNCPDGYRKACEHGGICTCARTCAQRLDCRNETCNEVHHPITGLTMYREEAHCLDSACMCAPSSLFQGGPTGGSSGPSGRR